MGLHGDEGDGVQVVDGRVLDEVGGGSSRLQRPPDWRSVVIGSVGVSSWMLAVVLRDHVGGEVVDLEGLSCQGGSRSSCGHDHEGSEWMWRVAHLGELFQIS